MNSVLTVNNLSKNYGSVRALNNVSFEVPRGSVFGILGPNGSGKTTLLGIIMDVLKASNGSFLWFGKPGSAEQRRSIGTLLETPNFYHYLSGQKNLEISAAIKEKGRDDIPKVLEIVSLTQRKDSKFSTYSLGMKQRLAIGAALLGDPEILVFDEPTNGLDPAGIAEIRQLIKELSRKGKTIIMASHILDEVEKVCTHVAILQKGVLKTSGTVGQVLSGTGESSTNTLQVELAADDMALLETAIQKMPGFITVLGENNTLVVEIEGNTAPAAINKYLFEQGIVLSQLNTKKATLEKRFLEITGTKSEH